MPPRRRLLRAAWGTSLGACLGAGAGQSLAAGSELATAAAAPVGPALQRPALASGLGARAVLQAAAQAGPNVLAVGERGLILQTTWPTTAKADDAGLRWTQRPCPVSTGLTALRFADARHGVAVGHGGVVLRSDDGGQQWRLVLDGLRLAQLELQAAQASGQPAALQAAERLVADGADKPWLDVLMPTPQQLLVVGAYGMALASSDGGQTWQSWRSRLDNPRELHLYVVRQRGEQLLLAGEQGLVLLSGDAGRSFRRLSLPYQGSFFTAELPADGSLLVAGLRGNAWRSVDGGASWQQLASPAPVSITASAVRPDGQVLLANQAGMVMVATPEAPALRPLALPPLPPLNGLLPLGGQGLLALSVQGALRLNLA